MVTIRHVGEEVVITPGGVSFMRGRDDKYSFIPSAYKLYMLIADHHHWHGKHLRYDYPEKMPTNEEMIRAATRNDPKTIQAIEAQIADYRAQLDQQIRDVQEYGFMCEKEREALIRNLRYMYDYRLQRQTNDQVFGFMIERLVEEIHTKEIDHIEVPPTRNFLRVLEPTKDGLIGRKVSGRVGIEATTHSNRPVLRLNTYGEPPKGDIDQ
jgi:hypothetical protein